MFRYVLIDYMHLAHKCIAAPPLSATVSIAGEVKVIDTTIPNYTIKNVFSYGGKGQFATGVFLEGGASKRKQYFASAKNSGGAYKGSRSNNQSSFYKGVDLAVNLMHNGGVPLYRVEGSEADDLIASMVYKIKSIDKTTPIDIITNDSDLLPLVDEQVSVFIRGTREHTEEGAPSRKLYYQVTPDTWTDYLEMTSAYGKYLIPYNSMLLFKLIRGDKADEITGAVKGYGAVKYSNLMEQMIEDGVDFPTVFRYGVDFDTVMKPILSNYFTAEEVEYMKFIYVGINPIYTNLDVPRQVDVGKLQVALSPTRINLIR